MLSERQRHFVEEQQVKAMKKRLEEAENVYGSIRKVCHEMKNHMANIKGLAGAGQYGEIPVFDLGIILNNLLDNAIEACEKMEPGKGFIRLALKRKKQFLLLNVENSFGGAAPIRKGSPLSATTKQSILPDIVTEHGIGLENVRDIAERYLEGVNIKVKGDVFYVTVMLQHGEVGEGK